VTIEPYIKQMNCAMKHNSDAIRSS